MKNIGVMTKSILVKKMQNNETHNNEKISIILKNLSSCRSAWRSLILHHLFPVVQDHFQSPGHGPGQLFEQADRQ